MKEKFELDLDSIKQPYVTTCYIPPGYYLAKLIYVEEIYTKNNEVDSINWYWEIIRGEKSGVRFISNTPLKRKYQISQYVRALIYKLYNLPEDTREFRPEVLVGGEAILRIATQKVEVRKGFMEMRSCIDKVFHPLTRLSNWGEKLS